MVIPDQRGFIDYEDELNFSYEFVDDNDDQDRFPDWRRRVTGGGFVPGQQTTPRRRCRGVPRPRREQRLGNDFNQNDNLQPDYVEPFCATMSIRPNFSSAPTWTITRS